MAYTVTYTYDSTAGGNAGLGRRTGMSDPSGSTSWVYDKQGRVTSTTQTITGAPANPYNTSFTYDAMDRLSKTTYPDNEQVTQLYNNQGLPGTLGSYVTASDYNA
ncbi:MAG TPA: hypothetical protein VFD70_16465, partial [Anaerolineae bacterium]|nr:hypothetical protein [Anaerolineae bacterium]